MTEYKTIKDLPSEEKPYEKFETRGAEALTDAELLAVLLRSGTGEVLLLIWHGSS